MPKDILKLMSELQEALEKDDYHSLLILLKEKNMDINCWASRNSWTPLHMAIEANKPELVRLFLSMGANPNVRCARGSAIEMACKRGNPLIVQHLLADPRLKGVKIIKEPENSKTTIEYRTSVSLQSYILENDALSKGTTKVEEIEDEDLFHEPLKKGNLEEVESLLSRGYAYDDHVNRGFPEALELGNFDLVNLIVQEGAYISNENLKKSTLPLIKQLLQLEKQKQIDMMQAYIENKDKSWEAVNPILAEYQNSVNELLKQKIATQQYIFEKIDALTTYGSQLSGDKSRQVIELSKNIRSQAEEYLQKNSNKQEVSITLGTLLAEGKKTMRADRTIQDIIAHIALALTGIGALILLGNKLVTGTFFLNRTKREQLLDDIHKDTQKIINTK